MAEQHSAAQAQNWPKSSNLGGLETVDWDKDSGFRNKLQQASSRKAIGVAVKKQFAGME